MESEKNTIPHAQWYWDKDGMDWGIGAWRCGECKCRPETWWATIPKNPLRCSGSRYCGNCGAKMDGVTTTIVEVNKFEM